MASAPITSWQIDGETMERVIDFIFLGSKITANGDCSHEIKRHFLLERKAMTNLESIWKSRDITLPTKVHLSQGSGFSSGHVWMWELDYKESWVLKNWCFWTMVLEKTLESLLDCKEIKPVHSREISPEYSLEGLMLKLKLQYFGHLIEELSHLKRPWCWEWFKEGVKGDNRAWNGWMASLTPWTWVWVSSRSWWWTGRPGVLQPMGLQIVWYDWANELNWNNCKIWWSP